MTSRQLGILNALVTFAAEHIPGGLSEEEQEVARIVGEAALVDAPLSTLAHRVRSLEHFDKFAPPSPPRPKRPEPDMSQPCICGSGGYPSPCPRHDPGRVGD